MAKEAITPTQFLNRQIQATIAADFLSPYDKHLLIAFYNSRKKKRLLEIEVIEKMKDSVLWRLDQINK